MVFITEMKSVYSAVRTDFLYEGDSNENLKSAIKVPNTAQFSCKLATVFLMV
jgi:hypothetical protein